MSTIRDYQQIEVKSFLGPWSSIEPTDVPLTRALAGENVEYFPGQVRKRTGFSTIQSPGDLIAAMENWVHSYNNINYNYLAFMSKSGAHPGINVMDLATGVVTNLYTLSSDAIGACFVPAGSRLYISTFNGNIWSPDAPRVYIKEFLFSSSPNTADVLFPAALGYVPVISIPSPGAGLNTPGTRNIGYIVTSRSGYTTAPGPAPIGYISNTEAGTDSLNVAVSPTTVWPDWVKTIELIATTTDNPSKFYIVPGSQINIAALAATAFTATMFLNISDSDLAATGQDATAYFLRFAPNNPNFMGLYGSRMGYVSTTKDDARQSVAYFSEPNDYQNVTADNSAVYLPGQNPMTCFFVIWNSVYLVGPHGTFQTEDTGDVPTTWPQPRLVDGHIGTLAPLGITVNAAQGAAWVCDVNGLYLFAGGAYGSRPVSYFNSDQWARINWAQAAKVKVVDDTANKKVRVTAPLDGASDPTHILVFDYTNGTTPETVNFSLDSLGGYTAQTLAIVQNDTTKTLETWLGPGSSANPILRKAALTDAQLYRDLTATPIDAVYETSLLPPASAGVLKHHGAHFRLSGTGNLQVKIKSLDGGRQIDLTQIPLTQSPAAYYLRRYMMISEAASIRIRQNELDGTFILSALTHYFTPYISNR